MSFDNVAIVYIKGSAYRIHLWYMSKDDAINIIDGSSLIDERSVLYFFFFITYKNEGVCRFHLLSKKPRRDTK